MAASLKELMNAPMRAGRLDWIGLRPARREALQSVESALVEIGGGLVGDHYTGPVDAKRMVSMIQAEHLAAVAGILGLAAITSFMTRRNLLISGLNLLALKGRSFSIGDALFAFTGPCAPCSRMDENLGPGGFQAMRGHGGIITRVLKPGIIRVGDPVLVLDLPQQHDLALMHYPGEE
ncbi:MOSC domain-containing protein [Nevskia sp.]|uniref:MOSC domain-containing protein n=1 Tax=Nevskia sp. TaxID=1929292 RepID=UPI0025EBE3CF|nr:MOSC domain-containing protein [Nevskia sp.]